MSFPTTKAACTLSPHDMNRQECRTKRIDSICEVTWIPLCARDGSVIKWGRGEGETLSIHVVWTQCALGLRSYKRHEENTSKIGQERSSMQQADYLAMPSAHSMNARKCVHAQKHYASQAFAHESSKVGGRGKRAEERQERKTTQQNKNLSEELKPGLSRHSSG